MNEIEEKKPFDANMLTAEARLIYDQLKPDLDLLLQSNNPLLVNIANTVQISLFEKNNYEGMDALIAATMNQYYDPITLGEGARVVFSHRKAEAEALRDKPETSQIYQRLMVLLHNNEFDDFNRTLNALSAEKLVALTPQT